MNRPFINELTLHDMPLKGIPEPRHTLPAADMATNSPICTRVFARLCVVESVYDFTVPNGMLTSTSASQRLSHAFLLFLTLEILSRPRFCVLLMLFWVPEWLLHQFTIGKCNNDVQHHLK